MTNAELAALWGGRGALLRATLRTAVDTVALWRQRARQRRHLLALEERLYRDIGVTAGTSTANPASPSGAPKRAPLVSAIVGARNARAAQP